MQAVGEGVVLALGKQRRIVGDRVDEGHEPHPVRLGEVAEHVVRHHFLDAGMADADA